MDYFDAIIKMLVCVSLVSIVPLIILIKWSEHIAGKPPKKNTDSIRRMESSLGKEFRYFTFKCEQCGKNVRLADGSCKSCGKRLDEAQLMRSLLKEKPPKPYDVN